MAVKLSRFVAVAERLVQERYIDTPIGRSPVKKWLLTILDVGKDRSCLVCGAVLDSDVIPFYVVVKSYPTTKERAYRLLVGA